MDYDTELHTAWIKRALDLAMEYREAGEGREVRDAYRALKTHLTGMPSSMRDLPPLPAGYEPHELPADYTGKLWIEGQVRGYGAACASHPSTI